MKSDSVYAIVVSSLLILLTILMFVYDANINTTEEWKLVALSNNTRVDGKVSGGLFVISGYIKEESVCKFAYVDNETGSMRIKTIPLTENEEFIYTNEVPRVLCTRRGNGKHYTFYVPEGSIAQQYNIDVGK